MDAPTGVTVDRRGPLLFLATVGLALVLVLALALVGVFDGGARADEDAWRTAVEQQVGPVADWEAHREVWEDRICAADDEAFGWLVVVAVREGASMDAVRTNVEYACPDRAEVLDRIGPAVEDVADACRSRPRQRSEEQRRLAAALAC